MRKLEERFLRQCLKPEVVCDLPGRLRVCFRRYALLPEAALPYLHYVREALQLLPGVTDAELNPRIGTLLILYDAKRTGAEKILEWMDILVDEGFQLARELDGQKPDEEDLARRARARLLVRLSEKEKGKKC